MPDRSVRALRGYANGHPVVVSQEAVQLDIAARSRSDLSQRKQLFENGMADKSKKILPQNADEGGRGREWSAALYGRNNRFDRILELTRHKEREHAKGTFRSFQSTADLGAE